MIMASPNSWKTIADDGPVLPAEGRSAFTPWPVSVAESRSILLRIVDLSHCAYVDLPPFSTAVLWINRLLSAMKFPAKPCYLILVVLLPCFLTAQSRDHDLRFSTLPKVWDEGLPLGNGMVGALIWQRDSVLRLALDRADLWDLRPIAEFSRPEFKFSWVIQQAQKGDYAPVQQLFDVPYDRDPAPTKIPAAALELPIPGIDQVESAQLRLTDAVAEVLWKNGVHLESFVHAREPRGWFKCEGLRGEIVPRISTPPYGVRAAAKAGENSGPEGNDLRRLGYPAPVMREGKRERTYHQECSDGFSYDVWVGWTFEHSGVLIGCWTVIPNRSYPLSRRSPAISVSDVTLERYKKELAEHKSWWLSYWKKSSIHIPDTTLETQWYRELYKFGSASRRGAPPITLQAVWTADNQRLPPWKGDFHNDLNTQLSYWPAYGANHLDEEIAFPDWLWQCKPVAEKYTRTYFGTEGLNFPGVATLTGEPMGGWIQYALSPTVSAWLAQHFYLHWRYSMDRKFLGERAYPWLRAVAVYLDQLSVRDSSGNRVLPLSSSPEIHDNRIEGWFRKTTNFDLALIRWLYGAARELAEEMGLKDEAARWNRALDEWPEFAISEDDGRLLVAPGEPLKESHRHFSHLMAIHPLGLLDWSRAQDRGIIRASLADLERLGTDWWCGYSFSWLGNMWARARNGEKAAEALRTFATCFCLPNSFHANGDQSGTGKSRFTYRPFTLEGNFACAEGIQEMLLQSQAGEIRVFPAVPDAWKEVSFSGLRAEGAFLVSANLRSGKLDTVSISCEKGGRLRLVNDFAGKACRVIGATVPIAELGEAVIVLETRPGQRILFVRAR
jgi:alpha-L-fucosidase 2